LNRKLKKGKKLNKEMKPMKEIRTTKSKFVRVRCPKCKSEQIIFGKATTKVRCLKCNYLLAKPSGGKAKIRARILEVFK